MSDDAIPQAVWSGSFRVFGIDVHCHLLDNGQRVIDADSVHRLFAAMETFECSSPEHTAQIAAFAAWAQKRGRE